jgi:hypothetical protein
LTAEEIADLLPPVQLTYAPWLRPIGEYGIRSETGEHAGVRFG